MLYHCDIPFSFIPVLHFYDLHERRKKQMFKIFLFFKF